LCKHTFFFSLIKQYLVLRICNQNFVLLKGHPNEKVCEITLLKHRLDPS
jgi:hypothetical protein